MKVYVLSINYLLKISFIILDILEASLTVIAIKNLIIKENKKGAAIAILKTVALSCQTWVVENWATWYRRWKKFKRNIYSNQISHTTKFFKISCNTWTNLYQKKKFMDLKTKNFFIPIEESTNLYFPRFRTIFSIQN